MTKKAKERHFEKRFEKLDLCTVQPVHRSPVARQVHFIGVCGEQAFVSLSWRPPPLLVNCRLDVECEYEWASLIGHASESIAIDTWAVFSPLTRTQGNDCTCRSMAIGYCTLQESLRCGSRHKAVCVCR